MVSTESSSFCSNSFGKTICPPKTASARERPVSSLGWLWVRHCSYLSLFSCVFNPIALIFLCVLHPSLQLIFCSKLATLRQFVHSFALQRLLILFFLGRVPNKPLDFVNLSRTRQHVSFSDPLVSSPSPSSAPPRGGPGTLSYLARRFLHAQGWRRQTRYPSRQQAPPKRLDLWPLLLPAEARARGEPCGELYKPLETVKPVRRTLVNLCSACI